jgi:hypothetical protein
VIRGSLLLVPPQPHRAFAAARPAAIFWSCRKIADLPKNAHNSFWSQFRESVNEFPRGLFQIRTALSPQPKTRFGITLFSARRIKKPGSVDRCALTPTRPR